LKSSNETAKELLVEVKRRHAVNLASRSHGAFVVSKLTSKATTSNSLLLNLVDSVFPLETYNFAITERTHITPSEAFCFDGSEGRLTVRLWANATIEAIEYEHDYWRDVVPISAPERYDVMACMDHDCQQKVLLGECSYPSDEKAGPAQICEMENRSLTTDQVQIVFRTNHGQQYTCVYLLRVLSWR
ncbi:Sad1 / UNC-like protein, partial [Oesophagostomum dentatum]